MHGDAVKARPGWEKTKMVAAQGSNSSVSTLRIRFLPLVVFSVLSCTFSEHYRMKSVDQRPPKSKAEFRTPIVDLLCAERRVKKDRMLVEKNPDRVFLKGQLNTRCSGWRNKKQGSCTGILSRENHCHSKPKEGNVEVRDLRGILVWIVMGTKPSGRTLDLYIYIYIANHESLSQHVTVGLAEARPN